MNLYFCKKNGKQYVVRSKRSPGEEWFQLPGEVDMDEERVEIRGGEAVIEKIEKPPRGPSNNQRIEMLERRLAAIEAKENRSEK